jgi:hypothetical protein
LEWHDIGIFIGGCILGFFATSIWVVLVVPILRAAGFPI